MARYRKKTRRRIGRAARSFNRFRNEAEGRRFGSERRDRQSRRSRSRRRRRSYDFEEARGYQVIGARM